MKFRTLGKTGFKVSEIGYGSWSLGADWGDVSEEQALETLKAVEENKINFIDTADVYGDGRSEKLISKFRQNSKAKFYVATKAGRRLNPHISEGYNRDNLFKFVQRSLKNLQVDTLDLLQLHCPPTEVYYRPEIFTALDEMVEKKMIRHYGVSVEKVEEALKAIEYPNLSTIQIIFNILRQRPKELFFKQAAKKNIGIIVRVPLASGLLTGKMTKQTKFASTDHRQFNRHGEAFDVGETFAGVDFATGLKAVDELKTMLPPKFSLAQIALKWILMHKEVSTVIAGGKSSTQVSENAGTSDLPPLPRTDMQHIQDIYEEKIKPTVHHRW